VDSHAYETLCDHGRTKGVTGYLLSRKVTSYFPGGYLVLDGRRVTDIVEKPGAGKEPSSLINIVAHIHNDPTTLLDALKNARSSRDDGYEVALKGLLSGHRYESVPYDGLWSTVKYPWHLLGLLDALLPKTGGPVIDPSASIHPTAVIEGPVILSAGVRIFPHATVRGPCFIGKNTIIANSALVRGSSIGSNCVIGYNTEVARSVLANDVWTHSSYIGDSAIGSNVSFGAGTTTGNLRLDEAEIHSMVKGENIPSGLTKFGAIIGDGCRTGIHTCTSPGIKIGQGTFVNSMTLVTEDVPDRSYAKMDNGKLTLRPNRISASTKDRDAFRGKL
jgi:bifunctional UDP-N-acetylglucosamine pyrophosphorylase/glucosamine-1-phosphate N-acetyltransferase